MRQVLWLARAFCAVTVLAVLSIAISLSAHAQETISISDVRSADQPNVAVSLSLSDDHGLPVFDLSPSQVTVWENGVKQSNVDVYPYYEHLTPINAVLALDTSDSMKGKAAQDTKDAARSFVENMAVGDQVGLVTFGKDAKLQVPLTTDPSSLYTNIDNMKLTSGTALYDSLVIAAQEANRAPAPRVVVLMTDGANWKSLTPKDEAIREVKAMNVPVFTIAFGKHADKKVLEDIASSTGGKFYEATNGQALSNLFSDLSQQLHQGYQLSYTSNTSASPGDPVSVKVQVNRNGVLSESSFTYTYVARTQPGVTANEIPTGNLKVVNPGKGTTPLVIPSGGRYLPPLFAALGMFTLFIGLMLSKVKTRTQRRLEEYVTSTDFGSAETRARRKPSLVRSLSRMFVRFASNTVLRLLPSEQQRQMVDNLAAAGHPYGWRLPQYVAVRTAVGLLCGVFAGLLTQQALLGIVIVPLGFYLPNMLLSSAIKRRQQRVQLQLPDALDLLTISVQAGLGFDNAMQEVAQKWDNEIAHEFATALGEMKLGKSRRDALRGIAKRVAIIDMQTFIGAIVQADKVGMSVGRTLQTQAEQLRLKRRQAAEEKAHKAVIKIIVPMVLLIFPSLFVVLLGPAIPMVIKGFASMGH